MEAEFYNATSFDYIHTIKALYAINFSQYGTSLELNENGEGFPVLRLNEFNSSFISAPLKSCKLLDLNTYLQLRLTKGDVLICRTNGNPKLVGKSALVPKDYNYAFASYLFRIRTKPEVINSATMVAFLNSKYGRMEIERFAMVGNQANFSPAKFKEITIPIFSSLFNKNIDNCTYKAFNLLERSECVYEQALTYLHQILEIDTIEFDDESITNKRFSDFVKCGRLDAEYYQPKYEQIENHVTSYVGGCDIVNNLFFIKDRNYIPVDDYTYKYIELSNIGVCGNITGHTEALGKELPSRARRIVREGDIIVSSLKGSLQSCALIPKEYDGAICSTGFYVLTPRDINAETSLVLFKSKLLQALMKRVCSGSIMAAMNTTEFMNINLPKIDSYHQSKIQGLIQECTALRQESERLLDLSKTAVEIAIEQGEDKAMDLLIINL